MLPRSLHLEQINRFHDYFSNLCSKIDQETDKDKRYELLIKYMEITKFWSEVDDFIEFKLKQKLDEIERD